MLNLATPHIKNLGLALVLASALGLSLAQPALAKDHGYRHDNGQHRGWDKHRDDRWDNHSRDDRNWRKGHWKHGRYNGRMGWWWVNTSGWHYYSRPVYPYPSYSYGPEVIYSPPVVVAPPPEPSPGINFIFPLHIR